MTGRWVYCTTHGATVATLCSTRPRAAPRTLDQWEEGDFAGKKLIDADATGAKYIFRNRHISFAQPE